MDEREMLEAMRAEAAQRNADLRKQAAERLKANAEWNRKNKKAKE